MRAFLTPYVPQEQSGSSSWRSPFTTDEERSNEQYAKEVGLCGIEREQRVMRRPRRTRR